MAWKAPPFPSELEQRLSVEDRSPDLRLAIGRNLPGDSLQWLSKIRSGRVPHRHAVKEALTVAGQWRIYTAFPNILTIVVVPSPLEFERQGCHELSFDDIHIYKSREARSQNC